MLAFILSLAVIPLATYFIFACFRNHRRLASFKGPVLASISESWLLWQSITHRVNTSQRDALSKYGSPARIGPNLLVTDDPELLRHMSAPRSTWTRGNWYEDYSFGGTTPTIFSEVDEKKHARLRAKLGPAVCFTLCRGERSLTWPSTLVKAWTTSSHQSLSRSPR